MDILYQFAWKEGETVLYVDASDRKYAMKNGNLAWRINNPGLIKHHCHSAKKNGSIGTFEKFAIFSNPFQGHQALEEWLRSKTMIQSDLFAIAKHYSPSAFEQFAKELAAFSKISSEIKLKDLTELEFKRLLAAIEKMCGYEQIGDEEFYLLPKIAAKIECIDREDLYLIGTDITLTQEEAITWICSHRLDAVVVRYSNGTTHLRSRPRYHMQTLKLTWDQHCKATGELDVLARMIGQKTLGQCTWGFINGIRNKREEAIESFDLISKKAGNELVISLRNDQVLWGAKEASAAILLKIGLDTPIVKNAVQFLRYLLSLSENKENPSPIILFAHSQGAAIAEHAIALLAKQDREKIRIFTFGGWSFIAPNAAHQDSHNYASVGDLIPRMGSFNSQYFAIRRYEGLKEGLNEKEIIYNLAFGDAIKDLDCLDRHVLERYTQERCKFYRNEFDKISNVTVIDSGSMWEHSFKNESYQKFVETTIKKYRESKTKIDLIRSQDLLMESFV